MYVELLKTEGRLEDIKEELELYPRTAHNFETYIENVLSVTANALLDSHV